ncbi:MAG TPA: nuclear transport factor 2 family protein [Gemmatimonadales bacterium]|nr:nuclear transport factor 2 family protein [Gemmatimonadales bacterium]
MSRCGKLLLAGLALAGAGGCSRATSSAGAPDAGLQAEIERTFDRSARDWNAGDLDGFMSDYARDSTTSYVSGGRVRYGYDQIRDNYASRFAPGASRDSLRFENLAVRALGESHALVTARFILHRDGRTTASGPFSVIMERRADGWKILHDHTSSD